MLPETPSASPESMVPVTGYIIDLDGSGGEVCQAWGNHIYEKMSNLYDAQPVTPAAKSTEQQLEEMTKKCSKLEKRCVKTKNMLAKAIVTL